MNFYRIVYRDSTVVGQEIYEARDMVKAAKHAYRRVKDEGNYYSGWSVSSITLI